MPRIYIYVVNRDLGFAPNPFHGVCTLATCMSRIRNTAKPDDWVFGVGGRRLKAKGKCIYAMKVTRKITYNEYWVNPEFYNKKPLRNGSKITMLGDNIYFREQGANWQQAHSHHSHADGSINEYNLTKDTKSLNVLISKHFYYFGSSAPVIPENLFQELKYKNQVGHRVYDYNLAVNLVNWIEQNFKSQQNLVISDPMNFDKSKSHYSYETNQMS